MNRALPIVAFLLASSGVYGTPDSPKPKPEATHKFYDRWGKTQLIAATTLTAFDAGQTCHNLSTGGHEDFLPTQNCGAAVGILAGELVGQELLTYAFHRAGWHKAERFTRFLTIQANVRAIAYSKQHGGW